MRQIIEIFSNEVLFRYIPFLRDNDTAIRIIVVLTFFGLISLPLIVFTVKDYLEYRPEKSDKR
jgi:hypothetical protein